MTLNVLFSKPPERVAEEEFFSWYESHLKEEMLTVPGMLSAQLYKVDTEVMTDDGPVTYPYAVVYEVDGSWSDAVEEQSKLNLANLDQYFARKKADPSVGPPVPEWFMDVEWAPWMGVPVGGKLAGTPKS
jgi:hypothetical protein